MKTLIFFPNKVTITGSQDWDVDIAFWAPLWTSPLHSVLVLMMETMTRQSSREELTSLGDPRRVAEAGAQGAWALA